MEANPDFRDLLSSFNARGVEYLVVAAYALAAHGVVRATKDLDVWIRADSGNAERTWKALADFGAPLEGASPTDFAAPGTVFQIGVPPLRIDIVTAIDGVAFDEAWAAREARRFADVPIHVLSRALLIRNKKAAGRPQDVADVARLESGE
jgi:hypothetical protein